MKKSTRFEGRRTRLASRQLVPAIAAIGGACSLAASPAGALELGDIQVESALGQPLRASIAYALGPNEQLYDFCIYLRPGPVSEGIPSVSRARVSLREGRIVLTGNVAVKDPLLNVRLAVDCPYSPHFQREYTILMNPGEIGAAPAQPAYVDVQPIAPVARPEPVVTAAPDAQPVRRPAPAPAVDESPIAIGSSYRVQVGDTASTIASRIQDRGIALWPAVFAIVDANPDAFIDGDVNQLIAGSLLAIPDFSAEPAADPVVDEPVVDEPFTDEPVADEYIEPTVVETSEAPADTVEVFEPAPVVDVVELAAEVPAEPVAVVDVIEDTAPEAADVTPEPAIEASSPFVDENLPVEAPSGLGMTITATDELRPGDVVVPPAGQEMAPANSTILPIDDADIPRESGTATSTTSGIWSWLFWLGGAGLAIVLALLMFGGKLRERFSPLGSARAVKPVEEDDDDPTLAERVIEDLDFNFDDPTAARAMSLDADLDDGSGLDDGEDIDVMQDFSFAAESEETGDLDLEITEDAAREPESQPTDIIAPTHRIDESSILESEVPPGELTGDYDMSMIIDATKQPLQDYDRTAQDLQAVRVDDEEYMVEDQTLNDEVDLKVLEQDYEDELTATQALNLEIEKAARELANRMDEDDVAATLEQPTVEASLDDATAEMTLDEDTSEATSQIDATGINETIEMRLDEESAEDSSASDATGINQTVEMPPVSDLDLTAELTANLPTDIEAENDPLADSGTQETVEMAAAGSDVTVEMQVESGKVDTKKKSKKRRK